MTGSRRTSPQAPRLQSLVIALDPGRPRTVVRPNGTVREDLFLGRSDLDVATWIHEMRKTATLHPRGVFWMGTEGVDGDGVSGDVSEVEISGIDTLRTLIVAEA